MKPSTVTVHDTVAWSTTPLVFGKTGGTTLPLPPHAQRTAAISAAERTTPDLSTAPAYHARVQSKRGSGLAYGTEAYCVVNEPSVVENDVGHFAGAAAVA